MKRPALVATLAIILAACESAAPVAPAAPDGRRALFAASGAEGVCNAVFAQLENRGTVEEHVLAAAARQNAELILQLETERKKLASELATAEKTAAKKLAELDAQLAKLEARTAEVQAIIAELEALLAEETDPERRVLIEEKLQHYQAELAKIQAEAARISAERAVILAELAALQARIAEIDAQLARGGC
jgi:chromosome segregation ATPase